MFLPYHAKTQPHFQESKRTYSHFIKICKYAKISWFLQMAGNLKSSYQLKFVFTLPCQKSASFSVSERTYSHFMEIRKYAKISWFLQMMGNLKTSYKSKYVFPYHAKNHHFHVSKRIYSHFIKIGKFCKFAKISWLVARGDMHWPQQQSTLALTRAYQIFQKYGVRRYFRIGGQNWVVWAES